MAVSQTYSQIGNAIQVLDLVKKEHDTKQARDPCGILCRTRSYLARN